MDSELKQKWVDALRSGDYEQGQEQLQTPDGKYCCLGVLCDIVNPDKWNSYGYEFSYNDIDGKEVFFTESSEPNTSFYRDVGLDRDLADKLICYNDGAKSSIYNPTRKQLSFTEIADIIEAEV